MKPKVSIVMSVYNGTLYLRESLESILNQTFTDFEFIIIDDKSTDNSWEILTEYNNRDPRIKLCRNTENLGLTKSLNKGLQQAQGEYIARQDADDVSLPDRFKLQTNFLDQHLEVGALGTSAEVIDEQGKTIEQSIVPVEHESIQAYLLVNNCLHHSSMMARRSLVEALRGYKQELRYAQDYDLWWRFSQSARLANLPDNLVQVRRSKKNLTNTRRQEQLKCALDISLKAVRESLAGQVLDEDAYRRFWWAYLRLLDKEAYQQFWYADRGKNALLQKQDIQSLKPFWQLVASHPGGTQIWGTRLRRLACNLLRHRQTIEGLQLLAVVGGQLKMPINLKTVVKELVKSYVPALG